MLRLRKRNERLPVLKEILGVLQDDPSSQRRWFHDDYFDLFLRETGGELSAFELCYGIGSNERALAWIRGQGFYHDGGISDSEGFIGAQLAPGDPLSADPILGRFERAAGGLPESLRLALETCLRAYALQSAEGAARRTRFRRAAWQRAGGKQTPQDDLGRIS
jgi:hypothetical protein